MNAASNPDIGGSDVGVVLSELGSRLREEDLPLLILCDEELEALGEPLHPDGAVGWYAELSEEHREVAKSSGLRSLVARGLLVAEGGGSFVVHPALELLRLARRQALGVSLVERQSETGVDRMLIHLVAPDVVLEEQIDRDGLHSCTMRSPERAAAALAYLCSPTSEPGTNMREPIGGEDPDEETLQIIAGMLEDAEIRTTVVSMWREDSEVVAGMDAAITIVSHNDAVRVIGIGTDEGGDVTTAVAVELGLQDLGMTIRAIIAPLVVADGATEDEDGSATRVARGDG